MKLLKIAKEWWIVDCPEGYRLPSLPGIGPYDTRWAAEEDMEGAIRFAELSPRQISVDSPLAKKGSKT